MKTLEDLLRMKVMSGETEFTPDFCVSVRGASDDEIGTRIIIHAQDNDSETLDFIVRGNNLEQLGAT